MQLCRKQLQEKKIAKTNWMQMIKNETSRIIHTCCKHCKHWKCCPGQSLMSCPGKEAVSCLTLLMGKYGFPFFFWLNWKKTCLVLQSRLLLNDKNMTFYQCLPVATWYVLCALPCSLLPFLISVKIFNRISIHSVQETTWRKNLICNANIQSPSVPTDLLSG